LDLKANPGYRLVGAILKSEEFSMDFTRCDGMCRLSVLGEGWGFFDHGHARETSYEYYNNNIME
jgi:hypothetical protein